MSNIHYIFNNATQQQTPLQQLLQYPSPELQYLMHLNDEVPDTSKAAQHTDNTKADTAQHTAKAADDASVWSELANMITPNSSYMTGWSRYNGSPSPIATAYNSWLEGKKNRETQAALTAFNAANQQKLAEINAAHVADAEAKGRAAEIKRGELEKLRRDQAVYQEAYNQYDSRLAAIQEAYDEAARTGNNEEKARLKAAYTSTAENLKTALQNMRDNALLYGDDALNHVSKRYLELFKDVLDDGNTPSLNTEATILPEYEAKAKLDGARKALVADQRNSNTWENHDNYEAWVHDAEAYNDAAIEAGAELINIAPPVENPAKTASRNNAISKGIEKTNKKSEQDETDAKNAERIAKKLAIELTQKEIDLLTRQGYKLVNDKYVK